MNINQLNIACKTEIIQKENKTKVYASSAQAYYEVCAKCISLLNRACKTEMIQKENQNKVYISSA